jgi:uncharacterized protein YecT (DUF1311 family)
MISINLWNLSKQWQQTARDHDSRPDFYLIRAVTILEVSTRKQLATLIDHSKYFTNRAVVLSKNFKMDFATVRDVQGRAITLGDIVAYSVPVNSFGQILDYYETLLGKPLRPLLIAAVDRWRTEIEKQTPEPIIPDFDVSKKRLSRLFEIRHILCHELPEEQVYSISDVSEFLDDAVRFTKAIEEILTFEKYGLVPLTQIDMNIAAYERHKDKQKVLDLLLTSIRTYLTNRDRDFAEFRPDEISLLSCFDDAQDKWVAYRKANSDIVAGMYWGGSMMPLIWAGEAARITESRITELQTWFDQESNL